MKCFFNCSIIVLGFMLVIIYMMTKNQLLSLTMKDNINTIGLVAMFGAILISLGLLNIFITFYITDKSEK